ncbi:MAG: FAD-dependent oxidoreductase [Clostridiales bacterium]|nr:FAD-dependent oxidoreductase [Clostridiales bacterium]
MMKKILAALMILALMLPACAFAQTQSATAKGFGGDVVVTLTIDGANLTNVAIEGAGETPAIGGAALEKLAEAMIAGNRVDVDAVAGATISSNAALSAAAEALAASGATLTAKEVAVEEVVREDETTDVLVIGGGGAGLTAAISAREAGANVILVEKLSFLGGCSSMSGGVILRAAIETDSEEDMDADELYEFLMNESEQRADAAVVRKYIDSSVDTYNWIYDNMVKHPENVQRYPMIPETLVANRLPGRGPEIMGDIADYAYSLGADIRLEVAATDLIEENGKVVGAVVRYADGGEQKIYAKAGVVLATGGFASSTEKLAQYSTPGAEKVASNASAGTVGDGLDMAEKVGAVVRFTDDWDTCGATFAALTLSAGGYDMSIPHKIMILNSNGERFINEANIQPTIYTEMRRQLATGVENEFWFIFDDNIDSNTQWLVDNLNAVKAANVEELAAIIGAPVENVQATIDAYNAAAGTDNDVFGKPAEYNLGIQAPYTVALTTPMRTTTIGGLCITPDAEVLKEDGSVVEGLYAAGELANSNFYGTIYTCGSAYGHAVIYGRIAGASAAANLN